MLNFFNFLLLTSQLHATQLWQTLEYQNYAAEYVTEYQNFAAEWRPTDHQFARNHNYKYGWLENADELNYDGEELEVGWATLDKSSATVRVFSETGTGSRISRMIRQRDGFCFLSGLRAIHREREICAVTTSSDYWALEASSAQGAFECRATCVTGVPATVSGVYNRNFAGTTPSTITIGTANNRVCYLTRLRRMSTATQECEVRISSGNWVLRGRSGHGDFRCEARCAQFNSQVTMSREVAYSGKGSWTRALGGSSTTFCFVSNVRNLHLGDERCTVSSSSSSGWQLRATSNQDTYRCGATCASVLSVYSAITMGWQHVTTGTNTISMTLTEGTERSSGQSVTNEFASSFSYQLASPGSATFGGVSVTSTISASTATSTSSSISMSASRSLSATCPSRSGMYVALYQYVIEGAYGRGFTDTVSTTYTRCHYSTQANVPAPQCPFQACGSLSTNPNCEASGCSRWR
jgi:hypothetical protein